MIKEAKLLTTMLRPTDCETVTEKEDHYEVIISKDGIVTEEKIVLGM